jgi:hypothetical protein
MINDIELEHKFNRMFSTKEMEDLQDISIFEISKDDYVVFKRYFVKKNSKTDIDVVLSNGDLVHSFSSMRNAICWCIFDKRGKYVLADRIITLDRSISNEEVQINVHKNLFKKAKNTDDKLIFLAKLNEDKFRRSTMYQELESYVGQSDYWQKHQFKLKTAH